MDIKEIVKKAGGCSELARQLGVTRQAVSKWKKIPPVKVERVSEITGILPEKLPSEIQRLLQKVARRK